MKIMLLIMLLPTMMMAQKNPVELGEVHWLRSMEEAQSKSGAEGKPIFILFQEIPGCSTCKDYGHNVLSHPLIVEAIETSFIPLAIHNNKGGDDEKILKRYNEPAWNNPVVRGVDKNGKDIAPRLSGAYTPLALSSWMISTMISDKGTAPTYLQLLADELTAQERGTATATYSMYCFWTGEALFGKINGVVKTTAGFQGGKEVVTVVYDSKVVTKAELDKIATNQKCSAETNGNTKPDKTPKYYLSNSEYNVVPMTEIQKCRVNSALKESQDPEAFLSQRQLDFLKTSTTNCVSLSLEEGWEAASSNKIKKAKE